MTTKPPDVEPATVVDIFAIERAANEGSAAYRQWRWKQPPMGAPPPASPYRRSILAWAWDFGWRLARHLEAKFDPRAGESGAANGPVESADPPQGAGWFKFGGRA